MTQKVEAIYTGGVLKPDASCPFGTSSACA